MSFDKDPSSYTLLTYAWVIGLAAWGGVANYLRKVRLGLSSHFSITELVGEMVTSGFVGVLTFWLCEAAEIAPLMSAVLIGISGHMGSRAVFVMENLLTRKFGDKDK